MIVDITPKMRDLNHDEKKGGIVLAIRQRGKG